MSQQELWIVVGRAKVDPEFNGRLFRNFRQELAEQNYRLNDNEIEIAQQVLSDNSPSSMPPAMSESFAFENKLKQERMSKQVERLNELSMYTVKILKDTLGNAAGTYKIIIRMNVVMFVVGIGLFLFAAFYAVFSKEKIYSLIFGGLGTVSFITLFLLGSIEKSQSALSNLVQVEISFMNYFEQISFWESFALMPKGNPPVLNEANIEKASEMLQLRSREIIDMLQKYVEVKDNSQRSAD
jgi:hypothetical protein